VYEGPLILGDGSEPVVLEEPARDYVPSSRPGGRLPHAWIGGGASTLDLIDPRVMTLLVCAGTEIDHLDAHVPFLVEQCPADAWKAAFGLDPLTCLVVRPDQHIAFRGPINEVGAAFDRLSAGVD
jgi:hypothetical protein